ncbi:MAG: Flp family type IVb pilin [Rhizobium sp.]|nr:Flp family type IVb pilin [Rhizobium sp.]
MTKLFARFVKDESGATAIEYGLIAALISVALITGATTLGGALNNHVPEHLRQAELRRRLSLY